MDLTSAVSVLPKVGPKYAKRLEKLGIKTVEDLLMYVPSRYKDLSTVSKIKNVQIGEVLTIKGNLINAKNIYTKSGRKFQIAEVSDESGTIQVIWFNQPFLIRNLRVGEKYSLSGKVDFFGNKKAIISPDWENIEMGGKTLHTGRIVPTYPETYGISSKWLRGKIAICYELLKKGLGDFLPPESLKELKLTSLDKAISFTHFPESFDVINTGHERLAFNELLFHQVKSLVRKKEWGKNKVSHKLQMEETVLQKFITALPYTLTNSQQKAILEIYSDLKKDTPMNRLLEGDVGSGKTVVAAAAAFMSFVNGFQSVFMAPTQILAEQHFNSLSEIFAKFKIRISLITSGAIKKELGKTDIFVGTHALIHKKVQFDKVSLVVIDEQHRFGVEQREHLIQKSKERKYLPNVLTMTATPIPRTVALTLYGDLDLSVLEELPKGRIPVTTWLVPPEKRNGAYDWIKAELLENKVQAFIICPLIDVSETETLKDVRAVSTEFEELKKIFNSYKVGLLHGRQKTKEKENVLTSFRQGKTDILVATPIVEVGIDVPNATIMLIEAGERFGLAQLHQLRGRIGRGTKKSYCLVFTESKSKQVVTRLNALKKALSGFELAELDLKMRGPGELLGTKQHGYPELKIASWGDTELIKKSREFAEKILSGEEKYQKNYMLQRYITL